LRGYKNRKLLYVGSFFEGSTVNHRYHDLSEIFSNIDFFNVNNFFPIYKRGIISLWRKFGFGPPYYHLRQSLSSKIEEFNPEIIFFDKSLYLPHDFLNRLNEKGIILFHYSNDDQINPNNQTKDYINSLKFYKSHFTTKSYNVTELQKLGALDVIFVNNATSSYYIKPIEVSEADKIEYGSRVGFIGTYEKERARSLLYLAENGIKVRIWGLGWVNKTKHPNLLIENKALWGEEYLKAICSTDINLNFLRKENRDFQTTRSIEIPASKGFMMAEYSTEHENLFLENIEAVYFNSNQSLLNKIQYYLINEKKRIEVAYNGYQRCISDGYYYKCIFEKEFSKIFENE
jgi:spore maturation protein CgeB